MLFGRKPVILGIVMRTIWSCAGKVDNYNNTPKRIQNAICTRGLKVHVRRIGFRVYAEDYHTYIYLHTRVYNIRRSICIFPQ